MKIKRVSVLAVMAGTAALLLGCERISTGTPIVEATSIALVDPFLELVAVANSPL